jgi:hypothetical protein
VCVCLSAGGWGGGDTYTLCQAVSWTANAVSYFIYELSVGACMSVCLC